MQKHLTQAPQPVFAATQTSVYSFRGFSYHTVFLFRGKKNNICPAGTRRLLQQYKFLNSCLAGVECAFNNSLSGYISDSLEGTFMCEQVHVAHSHPVEQLQ